MKLIQKTPLEIQHDLKASGIFDRFTQKLLSEAVGIDQGTVSRIANGDFKKVNKSVIAICKYAKISTVRTSRSNALHSLISSGETLKDPEKRKLVNIISLAAALLECP